MQTNGTPFRGASGQVPETWPLGANPFTDLISQARFGARQVKCIDRAFAALYDESRDKKQVRQFIEWFSICLSVTIDEDEQKTLEAAKYSKAFIPATGAGDESPTRQGKGFVRSGFVFVDGKETQLPDGIVSEKGHLTSAEFSYLLAKAARKTEVPKSMEGFKLPARTDAMDVLRRRMAELDMTPARPQASSETVRSLADTVFGILISLDGESLSALEIKRTLEDSDIHVEKTAINSQLYAMHKEGRITIHNESNPPRWSAKKPEVGCVIKAGTDPVSALNLFNQKTKAFDKIAFEYETRGQSHVPTFICRITVDGVTASSEEVDQDARRKDVAKAAACKAFIDKYNDASRRAVIEDSLGSWKWGEGCSPAKVLYFMKNI